MAKVIQSAIDKQHRKALSAEWVRKNRERVRLYKRRHYHKNLERQRYIIRMRKRRNRLLDPEKYRQIDINWHIKQKALDPEKYKRMQQQRKLILLLKEEPSRKMTTAIDALSKTFDFCESVAKRDIDKQYLTSLKPYIPFLKSIIYQWLAEIKKLKQDEHKAKYG